MPVVWTAQPLDRSVMYRLLYFAAFLAVTGAASYC
jgi:hypothetical protein